jgi:glutamyl/glutaminyl-tRNA synthetase
LTGYAVFSTGQVIYNFMLLPFLQELEQMKEVAKQRQLPPVYMGKWASASDAEVQQELEKGTPYTYRFRVPKEGSLKINDLIRGEVMSQNLEHKLQNTLPLLLAYIC